MYLKFKIIISKAFIIVVIVLTNLPSVYCSLITNITFISGLKNKSIKYFHNTKNTYFYHADALGSIKYITDNNGNIVESYEYKIYGEPAIKDKNGEKIAESSIGNPFLFTAREYDPETGLYFYRARYYDPQTGRFISEDPIGFQSGDLNLYAYARNNPVNFRDPKGLLFEKIWNDVSEKRNNFSNAITLKEFLSIYETKSLNDLKNEITGHNKYSAGGPTEKYRYIINPFNTKEVIDMRHFLVIGKYGETFGLGVEAFQAIRGFEKSAFGAQDFLSNYLGSKFYSQYDKNLSWRVNLQNFFNKGQYKCE